MKICPQCGSECEDNAVFCTKCGAQLNAYNTVSNPYDHTKEYSTEDIKNNKLFAALPYLLGIPGIIVALLAVKDSGFVRFHIKESLKIEIIAVLTVLIFALLVWTVIIPIATGVFLIILAVIDVICFFSALNGNAKEAPIIRGFSFLK